MKFRFNKLITISYSRNVALVALSAIALTIFAGSMSAQSVTNGNFSGTIGQIPEGGSLDSWSSASSSYNFVCQFSNDSCGSGQYGVLSLDSNVKSTGLPSTVTASGNYAALDGDFQPGIMDQSISGLTAGHQYTVSFYWGGAQQTGYTGVTSDFLTVDLCSTASVSCSGAQNTSTVTVPSQGFSGWSLVSFTFTATGTTEDLSFLATGSNVPPGGNQEPPFALVDGVSIAAATTPEVSSSALLLTIMGIIGGLSRLRSKNWLRRV